MGSRTHAKCVDSLERDRACDPPSRIHRDRFVRVAWGACRPLAGLRSRGFVGAWRFRLFGPRAAGTAATAGALSCRAFRCWSWEATPPDGRPRAWGAAIGRTCGPAGRGGSSISTGAASSSRRDEEEDRQLVARLVGPPDHRRLEDPRMHQDLVFHVDAGDPFPLTLNQVFLAVGDLHIAAFVDRRHVAGSEPAVLGEGGVGPRVLVVRAARPRGLARPTPPRARPSQGRSWSASSRIRASKVTIGNSLLDLDLEALRSVQSPIG